MGKKLIVCADGTWNDEGHHGEQTNVARVHHAIAKDDTQRVYYHAGVGTHAWDRVLGGAFGLGLNRNLLECYEFLVDEYRPGDEIYFFGFSRGAFTVRSLAGLIRNCGIVRDRKDAEAALALYRSRSPADHPSSERSRQFRATRAHNRPSPRRATDHVPDIRFIGVWDTVGALGVPLPFFSVLRHLLPLFGLNWWFHDTRLGSTVQTACHALSIHERRSDFTPTLWQRQYQSDGRTPVRADQELLQAWFAGAHSDVGGGYTRHGLSDLTYAWMVEQAKRCGLGFDADALKGPEFCPDATGPRTESFDGVFRVLDAVRLRFTGRPRWCDWTPHLFAEIDDAVLERARQLADEQWPTAGGAMSFAERIRHMLETHGGGSKGAGRKSASTSSDREALSM